MTDEPVKANPGQGNLSEGSSPLDILAAAGVGTPVGEPAQTNTTTTTSSAVAADLGNISTDELKPASTAGMNSTQAGTAIEEHPIKIEMLPPKDDRAEDQKAQILENPIISSAQIQTPGVVNQEEIRDLTKDKPEPENPGPQLYIPQAPLPPIKVAPLKIATEPTLPAAEPAVKDTAEAAVAEIAADNAAATDTIKASGAAKIDVPVAGLPTPTAGQPLPPVDEKARQELEARAKDMVKELDALHEEVGVFGGTGGDAKKKRGNNMRIAAGMMALLIVAGGIGAGIWIMGRPGTQDLRKQAAGGYGPYCDSGGCDVDQAPPKNHFSDSCYVNYYWCYERSSQCSQNNADEHAYGLRSASLDQDCGTEQIDTTSGCPLHADYWVPGSYSDFVSETYDSDCGGEPEPTATPMPSPTPTPPQRPDVCLYTTITGSALNPGGAVNVELWANENYVSSIDRFRLEFYNKDNPKGDGTPNLIMFEPGVPYVVTAYADPWHPQYAEFNISYNSVNRPDYNWGGQVPRNIQVNGTFILNDGRYSSQDPDCVESFTRVAPTPTPSRTPTPTQIPTPTLSPTPIPQCNSSCTENSQCPTSLICSGGYCRNPSCTTQTNCVCPPPPLACYDLTYTPVPPVLGGLVTFTCMETNNSISLLGDTLAEFRYRVLGPIDDYISIPRMTGELFKAQLMIANPGDYEVQCRICRTISSANVESCTEWGGAGPTIAPVTN
jgi:hypothetical protein